MKATTKIILIVLFISNAAAAQIVVTEYYNKDGKTKDVKNSLYYQVGRKTLIQRGETIKRWDTVFVDTVFTYYASNNTVRSRSFFKEGVQTGSYSYYHENKRIKEKGTYKEGLKVGYVTQWYDKGSVKQTLQYFPVPGWGREEQDSFKIVNYWDEAGIQLVKEGNGYCKCTFNSEWPQEQGKVVAGYRDSVWQVTSGDTVISTENFQAGRLLNGESLYKGKRIGYDKKFAIAEFKGGLRGLMSYLVKEIKYPSYSKRKGDQGKVFVKFIINPEGSVSDLEVIRGVSQELDNEALRVIRNSNGKWISGKYRGVPIKTSFVLPVYFKLDY